jgi:hypothetical protein
VGWTAPRTWADGEVPSASLFNQQIRDNFLETMIGAAASLGEAFYAASTSDLAGLKGHGGQFLRVSAGLPQWYSLTDIFPLARTVYDPGTETTYSTSSTSFADVDATNLAITFTAPASGKVLVILEAFIEVDAADPNSSNHGEMWNLRESTTNLAESDGFIGGWTGASERRFRYACRITGISAGSHTYKWGFRTTSATFTQRLVVGGTAGTDAGPALMEVWAAP